MNAIIKVNAVVRYPEDATVNKVEENNDNPTMPFLTLRKFEKTNWSGIGTYTAEEWHWEFEIDAMTGIIKNWPLDKEAISSYKVCDECGIEYYEDDKLVCTNDGAYYVPKFLCPDDEGYVDYMDMTINNKGQILNWSKKDLEKWVNEQSKNKA